jgi:dihydroorotase
VNADTVTLVETTWTAPADIPFGGDRLVPLRAGAAVAWKLA